MTGQFTSDQGTVVTFELVRKLICQSGEALGPAASSASKAYTLSWAVAAMMTSCTVPLAIGTDAM